MASFIRNGAYAVAYLGVSAGGLLTATQGRGLGVLLFGLAVFALLVATEPGTVYQWEDSDD